MTTQFAQPWYHRRTRSGRRVDSAGRFDGASRTSRQRRIVVRTTSWRPSIAHRSSQPPVRDRCPEPPPRESPSSLGIRGAPPGSPGGPLAALTSVRPGEAAIGRSGVGVDSGPAGTWPLASSRTIDTVGRAVVRVLLSPDGRKPTTAGQPAPEAGLGFLVDPSTLRSRRSLSAVPWSICAARSWASPPPTPTSWMRDRAAGSPFRSIARR
jgi:hypothetical protein